MQATSGDPDVRTSEPMTFLEWLELGMRAGWVGPLLCQTHDGTPTTEDEEQQFENGDDPCISIVRFYGDHNTREAVEANHSPSVWRRTNMGIDFEPQECCG